MKKEQVTLNDNDLCDTIRDWVSEAAKTGARNWALNVPVDFDRDPDVLISELVKRFRASVSGERPQLVQALDAVGPNGGVRRIAAERQRQVHEEGWTSEHDDQHTDQSIAMAAACYAAPGLIYIQRTAANAVSFLDPWPWDDRWDKRKRDGNELVPNDPMYLSRADRIRLLEKAGALIAAEIDRLLRAKELEVLAGRGDD